MSEWEKIEEKLLQIPKMRPEKLKFMRNTAYWGQVSSMDKQGRIVIQAHLRDAAVIDGEVAVIGSLSHLEVWNKEIVHDLVEQNPLTDEDFERIAELLPKGNEE